MTYNLALPLLLVIELFTSIISEAAVNLRFTKSNAVFTSVRELKVKSLFVLPSTIVIELILLKVKSAGRLTLPLFAVNVRLLLVAYLRTTIPDPPLPPLLFAL